MTSASRWLSVLLLVSSSPLTATWLAIAYSSLSSGGIRPQGTMAEITGRKELKRDIANGLSIYRGDLE